MRIPLRTRRADACAARQGIEGVANPDDHFGFSGERQNFGMKNFRTAGGEGVGFVITEFVEKSRFGGFAGIGGVNTIDVGPDDEFVGIDDVGDDGAGEIRTVASEGSDTAIGSGADEAGDDRHDAGLEERKQNVAATLLGLRELRLGFAESVAGQDEIRGSDGNGGDAGLFKGGGEEPGAEALAEGGEAIEEVRTGGDAEVNGNFMKKIASQELQFAADAKVFIVAKVQII